MRKEISLESAILVAICLADMVATVATVVSGLAIEQNPIMAACIRQSIRTFIAVKTLSFLPFIFAAEYYRKYNPIFVRTASRLAIVLYLLVYVALVLRVNVA